MRDPREEIQTLVRDSNGQWPAPPRVWSYSSLREAEDCPRRWMLSRASYPTIWSHRGYPPRPTTSSLFGEVVHSVLETVLGELHAARCQSLGDPAAIEVLKELGGYSKMALCAIDERLSRLEGNPRIAARIEDLRTSLYSRVPEIRRLVQQIVSRTSLLPVKGVSAGPKSPSKRSALSPGSHPEVELRARDLRFVGRADLLSIVDGACEITDYKTGTPENHHADQLRTYALLWTRDVELNPCGLPVRRLVLAYPTRDCQVDPPTVAAIDGLAAEVEGRISQAEQYLEERPPPARPSPSMCRLCGVRQLCDDYWNQLGDLMPPSSESFEWFDYEGIVVNQNGPRSWLLQGNDATLLVRTSSETSDFHIGDRVRLLNLLRGRDADSPVSIGSLTQSSESFFLDPPAP